MGSIISCYYLDRMWWNCISDQFLVFKNMNQGVRDLSLFLWKDVHPMANMMLPPNSPFCQEQNILMRDRVVNKVKEVIGKIPNHLPNSVLLSGYEGSGKTTLLKLLASSLTSDGYDVYLLKDAKNIPKNVHYSFKLLLEDNTQKVAILIDGGDDDKYSALFTTLFSSPISHLVTIGASATNYNRSFTTSLEVSDLALHEDEEDFKKLVQHCVKLNATSPEVTHFICHYLLKQCGGHIYPTLALMDHFFTREDTKQYVVSTDVFLRYFCGPDFSLTPIYDTIVRTCFPQLLKDETRKAVQHVLGGAKYSRSTLDAYWWGLKTPERGSPFLLNAVLSSTSNKEQPEKAGDHVLSLEVTKSPEENTDIVIAAGVASMERSDLMEADRDSTFHDTNVIAFNWARSARTSVPSSRLHFDESEIVRLFQGSEDTGGGTAIKVLRCAQPSEIERNLETFRANADKHGNMRCALLNFVFTYRNGSRDKVSLPQDETAHDQVYTFVYAYNKLFRGNKLIRSNAMPNMYKAQKRWYSTAPVRKVFSAATGNSFQFSNLLVKRAMTCVRNI